MLIKCNKYLKHAISVCMHMHKCTCVHTLVHAYACLIGLALTMLETENSCIIFWQLQGEGGGTC